MACENTLPQLYVTVDYGSFVFDPAKSSFQQGFWFKKVCTGRNNVLVSIGAYSDVLELDWPEVGYSDGYKVITFTLKAGKTWQDLMPCDGIDTPFYIPVEFTVKNIPEIDPILTEVYLEFPCGTCPENNCECEAFSFASDFFAKQAAYWRANGSFAVNYLDLGYTEGDGVDALDPTKISYKDSGCYEITMSNTSQTNGCPETIYGLHLVFIPGDQSGDSRQYAISVYSVPSLNDFYAANKTCSLPGDADPQITPPLMTHNINTTCSDVAQINCQGASVAEPFSIPCEKVIVPPCNETGFSLATQISPVAFLESDAPGTNTVIDATLLYQYVGCCSTLTVIGAVVPDVYDPTIVDAAILTDSFGSCTGIEVTKTLATPISADVKQTILVLFETCGVQTVLAIPVTITDDV